MDANYIINNSLGMTWSQPPYPLSTFKQNLPQIPQNLAVDPNTITAGEIDLTWVDNFGDQASFNIKQSCTSCGQTPITTIVSINGSARSFSATTATTGIGPDNTYKFYIEAVNNSGGESGYSDYVLAQTPDLSTPGNSSGSTSSSGNTISIPIVPGATNYVVQRSTSPNFTSNVTTTTLPAGTTSYTDNSVKSGVTYYYRVQATNGTHSSSYGPVITVTACLKNPAATNSICGSYNSGYDNTTSPIYAINLISCTTSTIVASGATLFLAASNSITFNPGFTAAAKSYMKAYIVTACGSKKSEEVDSAGEKSVTAIPEENTVYTIKIYPNPTTGMLTIETGADKATVGIYNIYGSLLKLQKLVGSINQTDISNLKPGTYIVKVVTDTGQQKALIEIKR